MTEPAPAAPAPEPAPAPAPEPAPAPPPEWLATLPDDLKGDATLARYADVPSLAKAHTEQRRTITELQASKIILPGADATDDDRAAFWNAIGRPETAEGYADLPVMELPVDATDEQRTARDEALKPYREFAHKIGLTAAQAKDVVQFDLDRAAQFRATSQQEVDDLAKQLGPDYASKRAAAMQVWQQIFGDGEDAALTANQFDLAAGNSARFLKGAMRLAEIAGEAKIIDSDTVDGFGEVGDADKKIDELQANKVWRDKFKAGDPATVRQHQTLLDLAKRQALRRGTQG